MLLARASIRTSIRGALGQLLLRRGTEQLADDILKKEQRIAEIMGEIKQVSENEDMH